jgi:hypothetical protein
MRRLLSIFTDCRDLVRDFLSRRGFPRKRHRCHLHCVDSERIHLGALICGGHGQQTSPRERGRYMQHRSGAGQMGRIGACSAAVCSMPVSALPVLGVEA